MSAYDKDPRKWDELAAKGNTAIVAMAKLTANIGELEDELGVIGGTAINWLRSKNGVAQRTERLARRYVERAKAEGKLSTEDMPVMQTAPVSTITLLVVCKSTEGGKVEKVLGLMGCEVVQV